MRRKEGGFRAIHLGCALCLALPAAVRLAEYAWAVVAAESESTAQRLGKVGDGDEPAVGDLPAQLASAQRHVAVLTEKLERAHQELEALGAATLPGRYRTSLADVIPVTDPSSRRALLWAALRDPAAVTNDGAAFWDHRLVGRVIERYERPPVAKIQLLNDPAFRVRFRSGDVTGVLQGQALLSDAGDPLLKVRFVSTEDSLVAGADVFTAGDDGVYPPGLWIGVVCGTSLAASESAAVLSVCAVGFQRVWSKVRIAVDATTRSVSALIQQGES
jgi:hypothetical protein